ncbi:M15 family metallopeptidase [Streptomyces alkaliterrae]|uniref:D-alanyl-D-alanine dipeptidase n=1 Tax=Streptomyces alkaliterrae TaxID=2213162 RepID=A0A5P0YXF0_9ACTN|nr:M15 family metallopeptidase [Streptomyces alkaliterrae]MBB1256367.1 M15 family metallopeptidase [Streptomyces alkaliterrae]MBB1259646.1 M15 family metallopeptidase [Streptomyces alkaliterrae]MQS04963.1 D-alanyl-D-alanine dipeptidase [Streptomyces alkaliterrae]
MARPSTRIAAGFAARLVATLTAVACTAAPALVDTPQPSRTAAGVAAAPAAAGTRGAAPPAGFVALREVDPTIRLDVRYATARNFLGRRVPGYVDAECLLTGEAARALSRAQRWLRHRGLSLKVYDCYRPQRAVDAFSAWAADPTDERTKEEYYPRVDKARLIPEGYIAERSGHSRGSTVDVSLVPGGPDDRREAGAGRPDARWPGGGTAPCFAHVSRRAPDDSLDMGTGYDCFDELAHTEHPAVGGARRAARLLLRRAMERAGFVNLPQEWWHYSLREEPHPATYFDFPVTRPGSRSE